MRAGFQAPNFKVDLDVGDNLRQNKNKIITQQNLPYRDIETLYNKLCINKRITCVIRYMNKIYSCEIFIAETYPLKVFANRFAQQF